MYIRMIHLFKRNKTIDASTAGFHEGRQIQKENYLYLPKKENKKNR